MEFDGSILGDESALGQDLECLQDAHGAGAVVICTWRGQEREEVIRGILVGANDCQGQGEVADFGFETSDDRGLGEIVGEEFERDMSVERRVLDDL